DEVKAFIDFLALYKMNYLHLHLADDQGWRIEIKSWPKLTTIGGQTEVGGGEGGFYTQEQYSELVAYAADRFISIVPEIDMPGHTNAALASYPELNCDGKSPELYTGTEVGFSTLCTDKEIVYTFVDDVVKELAALTPGAYIHVGGDESHVTAKPDYIKFVNRVQEIVNKHDKILMGWDEVTLAELSPNAIPQYWASAENARNAANKNLKVLMSPAKKTYLDMKYTDDTELGLKWAGLIEVDTGYIWDPAEMEDVLTDDNILGIEAPLWSETVTNLDEVEFMTFPRLPGYAEIAWTPRNKRNWEDYKVRLANQKALFDKMGIDYYKSPVVPW
ncbi:MAG: family 20 glycosylhydrolase, partial [Bacteroidota bacterium]